MNIMCYNRRELDMYDYRAEMIEDIKAYIEENDINPYEVDQDDLNDDLWIADSVTGNASGSYTFNSFKAKEYVTDNMDLVLDMTSEFGIEAETIAEHFLNEDWEWFDVSIRCYLLGECISEALEELTA